MEDKKFYTFWLVEGRYCHQPEYITAWGMFISRKEAREFMRSHGEPHLHLRMRKVEIE